MRILLANKFYYPHGGDFAYTINLEKLFNQYGHEVAVFSMNHPQNLNSQYSDFFPSEISFSASSNKINLIKSFLRPFGTREIKQKFRNLLDTFNPDIVHLNNIHTQLSPILAEIAYKRKIKVVWTLHDYKLLCPRYDCLRNDSTPCELCFINKKQVLKYKCMKNSMAASIIAYGEAIKWNKARLQAYTSTFICPSRFMKEKMVLGGFDISKLQVLNNFIDTEKTKKEGYKKDDYYCFIGRLSIEKGVNTLIRAASQLPYKLKIIGDGPLMEELKQHSNLNIEFLGHKQWPEIKELVGKARFSIIPSEWYENNPLSVIEALCLGTPVLGANIGGIPELIEENKNGLLFESGNATDLKNKIEYMWQLPRDAFNYKQIAENSQDRFSSEKYYKELMKIYNS